MLKAKESKLNTRLQTKHKLEQRPIFQNSVIVKLVFSGTLSITAAYN